MSSKVHLSLTNCTDCPNHHVEQDPDPDDWFCDDDVKVVCTLAKKDITVACRPHHIHKECAPIPNWCPLRTKE